MTPTYYTPEISEIHVGLICQHRDYPRHTKWETTICDEDLVLLAYASKEHESFEDLFSDNFRIKHLDREDIEGEGWDEDEDTGERYLLSSKYIMFRFGETRIYAIKKTNIFEKHGIRFCEHDTIFEGEILNLTEFRKLMKQLGIKKAQ